MLSHSKGRSCCLSARAINNYCLDNESFDKRLLPQLNVRDNQSVYRYMMICREVNSFSLSDLTVRNPNSHKQYHFVPVPRSKATKNIKIPLSLPLPLKYDYLFYYTLFCVLSLSLSLSLFIVVPSRDPYLSVNDKHPGVDSINISIHPIPEEYHNGNLLGYNIVYETSCYAIPKLSDQVNVSASTRSYILTGLLPGTEYSIRVAGFTSKGVGPYDWQDAFTSKWPFVISLVKLHRKSEKVVLSPFERWPKGSKVMSILVAKLCQY